LPPVERITDVWCSNALDSLVVSEERALPHLFRVLPQAVHDAPPETVFFQTIIASFPKFAEDIRIV